MRERWESKSKREISQIALIFCDEIRKAGYTPMLYMNLDWYNNFVDWSVLEGAGIDVWIAYYGDHVLAQVPAHTSIPSGRGRLATKFREWLPPRIL